MLFLVGSLCHNYMLMVAHHATIEWMKRILLAALIIFGVGFLAYSYLKPDPAAVTTTNHQSGTTPTSPSPTATAFDKTRYSTTDPNSLWVIANKSHPLQPQDYQPSDLILPNVRQRVPGTEEMKMRATAGHALETMFAAAAKDNIKLLISTAYRSYSYQTVLYNNDVKAEGRAAADRLTARPGTSEHQTGLAVDIRAQSNKCPVEACFGTMPEGEWLAANAYKYGFILRYPKGKESVTGYEYEPWHFRYVGTYLSEEMHKTGVSTLEEFFGVSGGTTYTSQDE